MPNATYVDRAATPIKSVRAAGVTVGTCHIKCIKGNLGCVNCCEQLIPGYYYNSYELLSYTRTRKNDHVYNPYDHSTLINQIGDRLDDTHDTQHWNDISDKLSKCTYIEPKNIKPSKSNELKIMSLNIRSINKHINSLRENLVDMQKYDVLCFNETNCDPTKLVNGLDDLSLSGFYPPILQKPYRTTNRGGGLAFYVNQNLCDENSFQLLDIKVENNEIDLDCEYMFLNITLRFPGSHKTILIGNFYRSPAAQPTKSLQKVEQILSKLDRHKNKHIVLLGDFNIDLIKHENDKNAQDLVDTTTSHGFIQTISRPTRITDHSATLIDHIYTNQIHNIYSTGIITHDISDHLATQISIALYENLNNNSATDTETSAFHIFNADNLQTFQELIRDETWTEVYEQVNTQDKYNKFLDIYNKHYTTAFPVRNSRPKRKNERKNTKPWILPWLEDACARKNKLYHEFVRNPSTENSVKYNKMKKFVKKHINLAKRKYYKKYFEQHSCDSKKQWQMINSLLNRNNRKSAAIKLRDELGNSISDGTLVAEKFNNYFCNIAENLKHKLSNSSVHTHNFHNNFLADPVANSLFLMPTHSQEISKVISSLKLKTTSDTKICALKAATGITKFNDVFSTIINSSFESGIFPSQLKVAKVVPIHKAGSRLEVENYRPISLLSAFSKIFEKLMHKRLMAFLLNNKSLAEEQYGFRAGRSCEHALLDAQNTLVSSLHKKQISMLLLIDFSKAFDMVDHDILLNKLQHYGVRGTAHAWFKSYLSRRSQYVTIQGKYSTTMSLKHGVPQGSILGPLLFIIYINDIPNINKIAKFILYADDANIIITGNSMHDIEIQYNALAASLKDWVAANGLSLNIKKTNYMFFSRSRVIHSNTFVPKINNIPIEHKHVAKFLGVLVDDKLTWKHHITAVKSKMSRYVGIMYRLRQTIPLTARLTIYNSLVHSHLNYCSLVWGASCRSNIDTLFTTQKKAVRGVMPGLVNYYFKDGALPTHTKQAFSKYNILTVHNIVLKNMLLYIYKVVNSPTTLPILVKQAIAYDIPTPGTAVDFMSDWYMTYNSIPFNKTVFFKAPLLYYNVMSDYLTHHTIENIRNINIFKQHIKAHLVGLQNTGSEKEWQSANFMLTSMQGIRTSNRLKGIESRV